MSDPFALEMSFREHMDAECIHELFKPEPAKLYDVPLATYLAAPGLSKSGLDLLDDCPLSFKRGADGETEEQSLGSLIHCLALEPERFDERYVEEPDLAGIMDAKGKPAKSPRSTDAYTNACSILLESRPGAEIVRSDDLARARKLATAIRSSGVFENLLGGAPLCERSIWFEEPVFDEAKEEHVNVLCKARPDAHREREHDVICVDLKTARSAHPRKFARQSAELRYHVSAFLTAQALRAVYKKPVVWIAFAAEKVAPYKTGLYRYGYAAQHVGRIEAHRGMALWLQCTREDRWPGYNGGRIADIELPAWLQREVSEEQVRSNQEPF